jgi:hypothetical protein
MKKISYSAIVLLAVACTEQKTADVSLLIMTQLEKPYLSLLLPTVRTIV